jgi:GNAT superfamily N-acetyltransferase
MLRIEKFKDEFAPEISSIIINNLLKYNSRDYHPEAINALVKSYTPDDIVGYSKNDEIYIAKVEENDEIAGTISLCNDQIKNVFIKDEYHGKGIGRKLMDFIEFIAKRKKINKVFLEANKTAMGFYLAMEYKLTEETDLKLGETYIKLYRMEKDLSE